MKLKRQKENVFQRVWHQHRNINSYNSLTQQKLLSFIQSLGRGSSSSLPGCSFGTLSEDALESARHVTQVPHPSSSGGLSPNGLHAPVIFPGARSGVSARRATTLLEVEAAAATPHTEGVGLVPPLTETPRSLTHRSCRSQKP